MNPMRHVITALGGAVLLGAAAAAPADNDGEAGFRALYEELVEIDTTLSNGSCTRAAEAMAARLRAAGMPATDILVLAPEDRPKSGALFAEYRGTDPSLKPIMLLAHIDVVEARREDWERDPFTLVEENGYFYARGSSDDKAMAAVWTDTLVRFLQQRHRPKRGLRLALTCGEETPDNFNTIEWLLRTKPEILQAEFVLNEGAGGLLGPDGKPLSLEVQAGEKTFQNFTLSTTNPGGHSSRPIRENAIVQLASGVTRLAAFQFPEHGRHLERGRARGGQQRPGRPEPTLEEPRATLRVRPVAGHPSGGQCRLHILYFQLPDTWPVEWYAYAQDLPPIPCCDPVKTGDSRQ